MLNVSELCSSYGAIKAVVDVDLDLPAGSLVAVIGSNGAGKSTTLNTIAGLHRPASGRVVVDGVDITGWPTHRVARHGVALVPEGRMVVAPLTVAENLELSLNAGTVRRGDVAEARSRVYELFPRLADRRQQISGSLSGGEQQMLALGRALMTHPRVLLLDEPSMGLAPAIVDTVFEAIAAIHEQGQSILLVEQNAELALAMADYAYVLERGHVAAAGTPDELRGTSAVREAYLG